METIRVNMAPCEDIKTIHASQNDNEAREWGFELHNNGEKIDSSSISDQLVFKAYKGGTEEILPTNGSTPTTSPFLGDIKYPQGLLSDQEFLYRESPTEEDGLAKITDIKGNTLVWNQLVQNGNFADTSNWTYLNGVSSISASNNTCTVNFNGSNQYNKQIEQNSIHFLFGHTYLFFATVKSNVADYQHARFRYAGNAGEWFACSVETTITLKFVCTSSGSGFAVGFDNGLYSGTATVKNVMIIDITQLNASYITDASSFRSYFPLPYYAYNQGTLLSFNGNGIKTVGKNQAQNDNATNQNRNSFSYTSETLENVSATKLVNGGAFYFKLKVNLKANTTYKLSVGDVNIATSTHTVNFYIYSDALWGNAIYTNKQVVQNSSHSFSFTEDYENAVIGFFVTGNVRIGVEVNDIMLTFEDTDTSVFEPYTSSTLSLPVSTYFPSGMKSAGSVYDELTESKAITRIGSVDLGTLNYGYNSGNKWFYSNTSIADIKTPSATTVVNATSKYQAYSQATLSADDTLNGMCVNARGMVIIRDLAYTDATAFKTAMNGIPLYFELSAYQETSFTTASLVTENAEIPLSNEDGTLIGKCTEQLSAETGFHDAKIKLSDSDGTCYSNKLQLHVERSPQ